MQTRGSSKLTTSKRRELVVNLCRALSVLKSSEEVAQALTDLLTPKEVETIAKRLQIAECLVKGEHYLSIRAQLKVGLSTIARVNTWLNLSGEGFKIMLTRKRTIPKKLSEQELFDPYSWSNIKRRYSMHFWPALLLDDLIRSADMKEKQKIQKAFEKFDIKKSTFSKEENKKLYEQFSSMLNNKGI